MTTKNTHYDGGPAFPAKEEYMTAHEGPKLGHYKGMSLRDWFAGTANESDVQAAIEKIGVICTRWEARYFHADEMLKERDAE